MTRLSLAMIVRDEAEFLGHCLDSVRDLVDEMIVVDTGSGDGTPELAMRQGAQVHRFAWVDDFAAARNHSLRHCTGDWVLVLDADEAIDALDHARVRNACDVPDAFAYTLLLRNYHRSGHVVTVGEPAVRNLSPYTEGRDYSHYVDHRGLRLFRRLEGLAYEGRIHELVDPFFRRTGRPVLALDAVIHHYGKVLPEREARKASYYLELAQMETQREPRSLQAHFNLLQQALMAHAWPLALQAAQACMRLEQKLPIFVLLGAAEALQHMERHGEALDRLALVLQRAPGHATALTLRGVSLAVLDRREEARRCWAEAIAAQPGFAPPHLNTAKLALLEGDLAGSRAALLRGLDESPGDSRMLEALVELALRAQDLGQAASDAERALRACPTEGKGLWHRLAALGRAQAGQPDRAREILQAGLALFPEDAELARLLARLEA